MKMAAFTAAVLDRFPKWQECYPGGNAMNQAVRFHDLGWKASFIGSLGNDKAGSILSEVLAEYGVDCSALHRVEGETASNSLIVNDAGERNEIKGAWKGGVYETRRLQESDWTYLSRMDLWVSHANHGDYLESLLRKDPRQMYAVDFLHLRDFALVERSLKAADIVFFGGARDMEEPLFNIAKAHNAVIVLTLGKDGSVAFKGENVFRQSALPLDCVIDTTGCGDAFQAGFTDSFYRFRDIPRALLAGAELGRTAASHRGGLPWPPGKESSARSLFS